MIHTAWAPGEQAEHLALRGFAFGTIEAATEPHAFTPDVAAPTTHETRVTRGCDLRAEVRQRRLAALRPLLGELQVGLQERSSARKRGVGLINLRRGRLKDVGHSRRDVQLDGDVGGSRRGGEARRVIQHHLEVPANRQNGALGACNLRAAA